MIPFYSCRNALIGSMRAARLATLPPAEQATEYTRQGHEYLSLDSLNAY